MNDSAMAIADRYLLGYSLAAMPPGTVFYHGARDRHPIDGMRHNAMYTQDLYSGVHYAFTRDHVLTGGLRPTYRTLFCCTLNKPITLVEISHVDWPALCHAIYKADADMPAYDGWLQQYLVAYLKLRYGPEIDGARLIPGDEKSVEDEFIFENGPSLMTVHRRID